MKYKSELIKEIVETRGHNLSSPHYESECVKSWIEETKEAYPKLCDYESEWLNYIIEKTIGNVHYETVIVNPTATINNVVPYEYKSAILKGQTSFDVLSYEFLTGKYLDIKNGTFINGGITHKYVEDYFAISEGTQVITLKGENNYKKICYYDNNKQFIIGYQLSTELLDDFTTDVPTGASYFRFNTSITAGVPDVSVNEYLHVYFDDLLSMTNKQGYTEGARLISCKMPVLTTSNEDGTKTNILSTSDDVVLRGIDGVQDELNLLTGEVTERIGRFIEPKECSVEQSAFKPTDSNIIAFSFNGLSSSLKFKSSKLIQSTNVNQPYSWTSTVGVWYVFRFPKADVPTISDFKQWLLDNEVLHTLRVPVIKTVALTPLNKPYKGTNHYHLTANIPCEAILEVPVVSTGKQTIEEINN